MPDKDMFEMLQKLNRDMRQAAKIMDRNSIRYMVDLYYMTQKMRKAANSQILSMEGEPNRILQWTFDSYEMVENNIKKALDTFTDEYYVGQWLKSITGIGPVISAGLMSRLDIRKAKVGTQFWSYCGLNPAKKWEKGQKCPWNMELKRLCFIIGDCFMKFHNHANDHYGKLYVLRKEEERLANEIKKFAEQAATSLREKNYGAETDARKWYEKGMLPPARIHMRAMRWCVKIFISHVHHVMYWDYFKKNPPVPYAFTEHCFGNHRQYIGPQNWPFQGTPTAKSLRELLTDPLPDFYDVHGIRNEV
jgi:hypothetical protein